MKPMDVYKGIVNSDPNQGRVSFTSRQKCLSSIYNAKATVLNLQFTNHLINLDAISYFLRKIKVTLSNEFFIIDAKLGSGTKLDPFMITYSSKRCLETL